jgi:hypothetical protein
MALSGRGSFDRAITFTWWPQKPDGLCPLGKHSGKQRRFFRPPRLLFRKYWSLQRESSSRLQSSPYPFDRRGFGAFFVGGAGAPDAIDAMATEGKGKKKGRPSVRPSVVRDPSVQHFFFLLIKILSERNIIIPICIVL